MKLAIVGLGRMGSAIAHRALQGKHEVFGFDTHQEAMDEAQHSGVNTVEQVQDLVYVADAIWLMLPAGSVIDSVLDQLLPHLKADSIIVDGGNSHFLDSIKRAEKLKQHKMYFLDCGVSGGLQGQGIGFCLMLGGDSVAYQKLVRLFETISAPQGFAHVGPSGAGHYVKMVHNGIEYALLEAYAEGLHLLKDGRYNDLDLEQITQLWNHGSIIRSWILQLAHELYAKDQHFENILGIIGGGQTGSWAIKEAKERNISMPAIEKAVEVRILSQETGGNYATKIVALLRNYFGGHEIKKIKHY